MFLFIYFFNLYSVKFRKQLKAQLKNANRKVLIETALAPTSEDECDLDISPSEILPHKKITPFCIKLAPPGFTVDVHELYRTHYIGFKKSSSTSMGGKRTNYLNFSIKYLYTVIKGLTLMNFF